MTDSRPGVTLSEGDVMDSEVRRRAAMAAGCSRFLLPGDDPCCAPAEGLLIACQEAPLAFGEMIVQGGFHGFQGE
jgi:hypothetical protein